MQNTEVHGFPHFIVACSDAEKALQSFQRKYYCAVCGTRALILGKTLATTAELAALPIRLAKAGPYNASLLCVLCCV